MQKFYDVVGVQFNGKTLKTERVVASSPKEAARQYGRMVGGGCLNEIGVESGCLALRSSCDFHVHVKPLENKRRTDASVYTLRTRTRFE